MLLTNQNKVRKLCSVSILSRFIRNLFRFTYCWKGSQQICVNEIECAKLFKSLVEQWSRVLVEFFVLC